MKLYQIIMKVPDDFIPEEMQLTASCKDQVEICSECFIGPERMLDVSEEEANNTEDPPLEPDQYSEGLADEDAASTEESIDEKDS